MPRRRRVFSIVILLALLGAGGGYWLAHGGGPSPVLRTVTVGATPGQVVVDAATGRAFVNNYADQSVSVLNAGSGTVLRTDPIGDFNATLVVDAPTQRVFLISDDSDAGVLLDAARGAMLDSIYTPVFNAGAVDPRTGHLFSTTSSHNALPNAIVMFDGRSGAQLRGTDLAGSYPLGVAVDARTDRVFAANAGDSTASMVQASSGRLLRTVKVGSWPVVVAVDTQTGRVFIPNTGANTVSVLDARSGAVLRTVAVAPHPAAAVVDERTDRVFLVHGRSTTVGAYSGSIPTFPQVGPIGVTVLDARTGSVLRTLPVGGSLGDDLVGWAPITTIAVDARRSRVFVINRYHPGSDGDGSVSVLDARSGSLLRTIGVGRHPISLAVDERTARLFVVNTNADCTHTDVLARIPDSIRRLLGLRQPDTTCRGSVTVIDTSRL